jgi:hypothetical protein
MDDAWATRGVWSMIGSSSGSARFGPWPHRVSSVEVHPSAHLLMDGHNLLNYAYSSQFKVI